MLLFIPLICISPMKRTFQHVLAGAVISEEEISTELIHVGDVLKVLPGATIPTDGVVVLGRSAVDEAMITGE